MTPHAPTRPAAMLALALAAAAATAPADEPAFLSWAPTPPMGWNSWDCFATTVTEAQARAQADVMADMLKQHGWQYVVVDIQWYEPGATGFAYRADAEPVLDACGRLLPAPNRFPSAADGAGFKPLADYVHAKGLKFGIHLMRGIPRLAVRRNLPVANSNARAADIADPNSTCPWNPDMFGVDMAKPGAQAYYDSVLALIASWGVDYLKVDDISRPYHQPEVEAIRSAIDKTGRPIVLSLSPGETPLSAGPHVGTHANLWRISDDFWDDWPALHAQFRRLHHWTPHRGPGHWPDADMLPLGTLRLGRETTRFTRDEQVTLMTLWSIARSPLMIGADLTKLDDFTRALLTNDEVLAVNQHSSNNRRLFELGDFIAWTADAPDSTDRYLALFNAPPGPRLRHDLAVFSSDLVTAATPGRTVEVEADLAGSDKLFLVVSDGGDNFHADHADWLEPRLTVDGHERPLTGLEWRSATSGWKQPRRGRSVEDRPLTVAGTAYQDGIGTHSTSVIEYDLPPGTTRFRALAALDDGGTSQGFGATVRFHVFTRDPFGPQTPARIPVAPADLGFAGPVTVRDLWARRDLGRFEAEFAPEVPHHGAGLFRVAGTPANRD